MAREPCCSKQGLKKGAWSASEDKILCDYIRIHGEGKWRYLPRMAGLKRCGKSCRLRWLNYLRPNIKRGNITEDERDLIIRLHKLLGNRWSLIAGRLPGRTDNEIKNYWNTILAKNIQDEVITLPTPTVNPTKSLDEPKQNQNSPQSQSSSHSNLLHRPKASRCTKVLTEPVQNMINDTSVAEEPYNGNSHHDEFMYDFFNTEFALLTEFVDCLEAEK